MNDLDSSASSRPAVHPYAWVILAVVFLASIAAPLNQSKVPPLMPVLMEAFRLGLGPAGWLMSVFALTGVLLSLPAGFLLQRFGPKACGATALACLVLGAILGALSGHAATLLLSRVIEGVGMGLIAIVAPAAIAMWFPADRQGTPMGIWATWVPVGTVAMYALAPALAARTGWQAVWWVGAGFSLVALVLYLLLMRLPPWLRDRDPAEGAPVALREVLTNRRVWLLALEFACFNLVFLAIATFYPTFLSEVRGYSLREAAFISSVSTVIVLFSAPLAGWLSDRIGSRRLVFSIPFLIIGAMMALPFRVSGWQIYAFMLVLGLIAGAIPTATFAAAPEVAGRPDLAGLALAVVILGQNLGMFTGPILFGSLVERMGWVAAGYGLIPACVLGFVAGWSVRVR